MAYKLYTDKATLFECKIELEGASLRETVARLVIEAPDRNLLFVGKVNEHGMCEISVDRLRDLLGENVKGQMKLEVIAEDIFFQPWSSDFITEASRKLSVEVKTPTPSKPILRTEVVTPTQRICKEIAADLQSKGITLANINDQKRTINASINEHLNRINYKGDRSEVITTLVTILANKG